MCACKHTHTTNNMCESNITNELKETQKDKSHNNIYSKEQITVNHTRKINVYYHNTSSKMT